MYNINKYINMMVKFRRLFNEQLKEQIQKNIYSNARIKCYCFQCVIICGVKPTGLPVG